MTRPTLADLDLHGGKITHHRYIRNDAAMPEGWTDDGPCPGHHGHWSRMARLVDARQETLAMALTPDEMEAVRHPAHYKQGEVEVIDIIEQITKDYPPAIAYHVGNALKYLARAPHKGAMQQDLQKADWYLARAINRAARS